ncbi:hypothetical protein EYF80_055065 [Liparis tanakae]|uniref:Uncharacterized protein n=1 Tax=Liparis tanakae TaxID=230148 RepID=A0A4Z2F2P6_9TELE|nr:hypothetical protein EYF80_055065 [Liparis tanakae]
MRNRHWQTADTKKIERRTHLVPFEQVVCDFGTVVSRRLWTTEKETETERLDEGKRIRQRKRVTDAASLPVTVDEKVTEGRERRSDVSLLRSEAIGTNGDVNGGEMCPFEEIRPRAGTFHWRVRVLLVRWESFGVSGTSGAPQCVRRRYFPSRPLSERETSYTGVPLLSRFSSPAGGAQDSRAARAWTLETWRHTGGQTCYRRATDVLQTCYRRVTDVLQTC